MSLYLAVFNDLNAPDDVRLIGDKITSNYELNKSSFRIAKNVYVIASDELVENVARRIGLQTSEIAVYGVVCMLNGTYSGANSPELWRFLDSHAPR